MYVSSMSIVTWIAHGIATVPLKALAFSRAKVKLLAPGRELATSASKLIRRGHTPPTVPIYRVVRLCVWISPLRNVDDLRHMGLWFPSSLLYMRLTILGILRRSGILAVPSSAFVLLFYPVRCLLWDR